MAKAGVIHLAKVAAAELGAFNIRVNAICPGTIVTPIFDVALGKSRKAAEQGTDRFLDAAAKMQPIRRAGIGADIARTALYLASDDSSFVTGTCQVVDGGATVGPRNAWDRDAVSPLVQVIMAG